MLTFCKKIQEIFQDPIRREKIIENLANAKQSVVRAANDMSTSDEWLKDAYLSGVALGIVISADTFGLKAFPLLNCSQQSNLTSSTK